jgi:hypothetical protein
MINKPKQIDGFEYIPSLKLYVTKEKKLYGKDWFDSHKELQANGERMLTLLEFVEFLKYAKDNLPEIYKDIATVRSPDSRAEWIDADFKVKNGELYINYNHILDSKGNLIPNNSEPLDKDTFMEDKKISLEDYLDNNHTSQGLPSKKVNSGNLHYMCPGDDSVASFYETSVGGDYFTCDRGPSCKNSFLGVRAVRE